jgi:hypothetical protein
MFASGLTPAHIGQDLTITVGRNLTGGIIRSVVHIFGMVSVDLDGQVFVLESDKSVELNAPFAVPYADADSV